MYGINYQLTVYMLVVLISSAVNCKLLLYADDSTLIVPGKDVMKLN